MDKVLTAQWHSEAHKQKCMTKNLIVHYTEETEVRWQRREEVKFIKKKSSLDITLILAMLTNYIWTCKENMRTNKASTVQTSRLKRRSDDAVSVQKLIAHLKALVTINAG